MRILMVTPRFPYPLDKGDKLRAFHQIRLLSLRHQVGLFALTDKSVSRAEVEAVTPYLKDLHIEYLPWWRIGVSLCQALTSREPFQTAYHSHPKAIKRFREFLERFLPDVLYFQLLRTFRYAMAAPGRRLLLDMMDPFAKNLALRLPFEKPIMRFFLREEEARLDYYERLALERFSRVAIISARDREDIRSPAREEVFIIPNGIDTSFYAPWPSERVWDVCFVGSLRYPSNTEAALFLARDVMPQVWRKKPNARLVLVGADPPWRVRRLRNRLVHVTGRVSDTRAYYAASRVFCAPMFLNTGIQNKILEAMAMGLPVVTTSRVNDAIKATPGEHLLIADEAAEMADHILNVLECKDLAAKLASHGRIFVQHQYSWEKVEKALEGFFAF
ncbi:MAG: glycosyltransferase [Flavobacteriales bacterium]|nr:glycosyltransferase [Flavobacteriales bacterium]MDW8409839.1 glycosyltransferase [Flavobacteriales bacterium]